MHTRNIVALSVVLGFSFIFIMVVVARFLWMHNKPEQSQKAEHIEYSVEPVKRSNSLLSKGGALKKIFTLVRAVLERLGLFHFCDFNVRGHQVFGPEDLYHNYAQQCTYMIHSLTYARNKSAVTMYQHSQPSSKPVTKPSTRQCYSAPYKDTPAPFPSKLSTMPSRMNCGPALRQNARPIPPQSLRICQ
jgi:hypothetical protein